MTSAIVSISTFLELAPRLPADDSLLLRGDHGIGKSTLVRQVADLLATQVGHPMPVVDVRISQMSDGDMIGLPVITTSQDGREMTKFAPPAWYMECVENPRVLFLDEFNRGTSEIMQACFQIVLDRALNGVQLHPQTRVMAAVNMGAAYNVNSIDPALLDRVAVFDLVPDVDTWLSWARTPVEGKPRIHENITSFIAQQPMFLDPPRNVDSKSGGSVGYDPSEVHPSRRSWERVDRTLKHMKIQDSSTEAMYYHVLVSRLGTTTAATMKRYLDTALAQRITGAQILDDYLTVDPDQIGKKKKTKKTDPVIDPKDVANLPEGSIQARVRKLVTNGKIDTINQIIDDVIAEIEKRDLSTKVPMHIKYNLSALFGDLPHELRYTLYTSWSKGGNPKRQELILDTHEYVINHVLAIYGMNMDNRDADGNLVQTQTEEPEFIKKAREAEAAKAS